MSDSGAGPEASAAAALQFVEEGQTLGLGGNATAVILKK